MKRDPGTLLIGSVLIVGALFLIARQGKHTTPAGGACCPFMPNLGLSVTSISNQVPAFTNAKAAVATNIVATNYHK